MKKAIVSDMDGTLLTEDKKLLERTKNALIAWQKAGNILILASGRVKPRMMEYALDLQMDVYGGYFIEANGSVIYDIQKDKRDIMHSMSYEEADVLFTYLRKTYPTHEIMIMGDKDAYVNLPDGESESTFFNTNNMESLRNRTIYRFKDVREIKETFYKMCIYKDAESVAFIMEDLKQRYKDVYWCGRTMPMWCEIMPLGINKGNALQCLLERLNVGKENVYIFGDGENDISMFSLGHSIAMKNALPNVQEASEYITDSNEDNGIAKFLEEKLL